MYFENKMDIGILKLGKKSLLELEKKCVITYLIHWLQLKVLIRGNNHSSFESNFSDPQPEEEKVNIWEDTFFTSQKEKASDLTRFYLRSENANEEPWIDSPKHCTPGTANPSFTAKSTTSLPWSTASTRTTLCRSDKLPSLFSPHLVFNSSCSVKHLSLPTYSMIP